MTWLVERVEPTDPTCTAALNGGGVLLGAPVWLHARDDETRLSVEALVTVHDGRLLVEELRVRHPDGVTAKRLRRVAVDRLVRSLTADFPELEAAQRRTDTIDRVVEVWKECAADPATRHRPTAATAERLYLHPKYVSTLLTRARREHLLD